MSPVCVLFVAGTVFMAVLGVATTSSSGHDVERKSLGLLLIGLSYIIAHTMGPLFG
jgi:hypothetical protein